MRTLCIALVLTAATSLAQYSDAPTRAPGMSKDDVAKTLYALGSALPMYEPATPPKWLSRAMNRIRREPEGQRFEDMWVKDQAAEARRRVRNDEVWTGAGY